MDDFEVKTFDELIGYKKTMEVWKKYMKEMVCGKILFVSGFSGVGKTRGTKLLLEEFQWRELWLDSSKCNDGKDIYDQIMKFHNWMDLNSILQETSNDKQKIIVIDELESLIKLDRNILSYVIQYIKKFKSDALPIVLIGHVELLKRIGEMKEYIDFQISLQRLQDIDIFLFLKKRIPKNKIKLTDLMRIAEDSKGNIYIAVRTLQQRLGVSKKKASLSLITHYIGDEQKTFPEIFECKNPVIIRNLLLDDSWMHPLKIHENIIQLLDESNYCDFLKDYHNYEQWNYHMKDSIMEDMNYPIYYLTYLIIYYMNKQGSDGKLINMEFSKLLSYISTQKKYKKLVLDKVTNNYPIEDVGYYWLQTTKDSSKKNKSKDDENFL